jgi:hypothetical protein
MMWIVKGSVDIHAYMQCMQGVRLSLCADLALSEHLLSLSRLLFCKLIYRRLSIDASSPLFFFTIFPPSLSCLVASTGSLILDRD